MCPDYVLLVFHHIDTPKKKYFKVEVQTLRKENVKPLRINNNILKATLGLFLHCEQYQFPCGTLCNLKQNQTMEHCGRSLSQVDSASLQIKAQLLQI